MKRELIFICIMMVSVNYIFAQETNLDRKDSTNSQTESETVAEDLNSFKFTSTVGTNIIQNGKKMSIDEYYIKPSLTYYRANGLSAYINFVYMPQDKKQPLDNINFDLGYEREFLENFTWGIDYTYSKYFSAKQVRSSIPHNITFNTSWYNPFLSPTIYAFYGIGTSANDITFSADLSHVFIFKGLIVKNDKLSFPLLFGAYAGTSNFYESYSKKNTTIVTNTTSTTKFGFTSAYLSISIKYKIGFFSLGASTNYNIPLNQGGIFKSTNLPVYSANISFYF